MCGVASSLLAAPGQEEEGQAQEVTLCSLGPRTVGLPVVFGLDFLILKNYDEQLIFFSNLCVIFNIQLTFCM